MYDYKDRTMFITGGSTGIGYKAAEYFLKAGGNVVFISRNRENGVRAMESLKKISSNVEFIRADVSVEEEVKNAVSQTAEIFGTIDFAFNNAGIEGVFKPLNELTFDQFRAVIDINMHGVFLSMKYEIEIMLKNGSGVIVNTSSVSGMMNFPRGLPYVVSKHGVESITKCTALEYASQGIRINAIAPGEIRTPMSDRALDSDEKRERLKQMLPVKYIGEPDVIAEGVLWLCSEHASYITGATLPIDGGYTARL